MLGDGLVATRAKDEGYPVADRAVQSTRAARVLVPPTAPIYRRPVEVDRAAAHDRYDRALGRAGAFLRGMQRRDGSTARAGSVWGYYSQPLALLSGGSPEDWSCANRCLDFVRREHVTAAGTVGVEPLPYVGDLYVYPYLIRGAATWGRTDLSVTLARSLARFQDPCGGIRYRIEAPGLIDPATTAHGGIALLATGHLQHAQRAGRFLLRLHRMQRDPADRYLTVWDTRCDAPVADCDSGADMPWGSGSALRRDNPEGGNAYWDIGYIIAFLTALSRATGSHEYLGAAREMFDLFDGYAGFADHVWKTPWACAALHQATGEPRYLAAAVRMADRIVDAQQADGGFFLGPQSCYLDEAAGQWSHAFSGYEELQANPDIFIDTAAQMAHYLAQVRAVI